MKQKKRLGDLFVEDGLLSREILESSIEENKDSEMKLGQFLISSGVVAEERIVDSLSRQLGIPRLTESDMQPSGMMAELIPQSMADQYQIVPLRDDPLGLVCAMLDPMDLQSLERIEEIVNKPVDPVICTTSQFKELEDTKELISFGPPVVEEELEEESESLLDEEYIDDRGIFLEDEDPEEGI